MRTARRATANTASIRLRALLLGLVIALVGLSGPAMAQDISISLGDGEAMSARIIQMFLLVTLLSLAPGIAIMVTCFPFMVTTLSILRQAIGLQAAPPNMMIVSLALFLTYFVMAPVFSTAWENGIQPMIDGTMTDEQAFSETLAPFVEFMSARVDPQTLASLTDLAPKQTLIPEDEAAPLSVLIPSFMLSEIQRAFEVGFMIFLPFLIIDLVVASVLMAMGMMMVPPAVVSLPFKLAFFVMADGWTLLAGALVTGYTS
ncbi:MAG: flagellar type III secretion system pore protein FliP [Neomegalonema sp.]|nr:flagellar type III secretion system pore protein FliP [Neomegalonema sp.]